MNVCNLKLISYKIGEQLSIQKATITTAESCTGGWIAKIFTDISGSSAWFNSSFVTYSDKSKRQILGVNHNLLIEFGSVSEIVTREMAILAKNKAQSSYSIAVSGIAGPSGGSLEKPIGTVWFGFASFDNRILTIQKKFFGNRNMIRYQSVLWALKLFYKEFLIH
ncbi:MAG: nicotinamide-nucleotide amidase [Pantoea sp. Brub]|nr:nicotinamide-nucleotide amidase [Pantoea sp. Brub]